MKECRFFQPMKIMVEEAFRQGLSFTQWLAPLEGSERGAEYFPLDGRTNEESTTMRSAWGCNAIRLTGSKVPLKSRHTSTRTSFGRATVDVYGVA